MLISIIMPVKNTAKYLPETLNSILAQTEPNWELIAVENNSPDSCFEILSVYAQKDKRIKVFRNQNGELIPSLQLAVSKVSGELITRMDSDDIMPKNRLEIQKKLLLEKGKGHVATGKVHYFADGKELMGYKWYEEWLNKLMHDSTNFSEIYKECVIPSPCWMMYNEDFIRIGAFDRMVYPEDYDLCFRMYENGIQVVASREILHYWRDYDHRNSRTDPNYADQLFFDLKMPYFLKVDYDKTKNLVLWGIGKKGKNLAKMLLNHNVPFEWVTDNPNKIGKIVYGVQIASTEKLSQNAVVIIAVSNEAEQNDINERLKNEGLKGFNFC